MAKPVDKYGAERVDMGWRVRAKDFVPGFEQSPAQYNVSPGIYQGLGPRYGMSPLPGHSDKETRTAPNCNGLAASEGTTGVGLINRVSVYGIMPMQMAPYDGAYPKQKQQSYLVVTGVTNGGVEYLDASFLSTYDVVYKHSANVGTGLAESSYFQDSPLKRRHKLEQIKLGISATANDVKGYFTKSTKRYLTMASIGVAGKRVPYNWMLANQTGVVGSSTRVPDLNLWTTTTQVSGVTTAIYLGMPSEFINSSSTGTQDSREIFVFGFKINAVFTAAYIANINQSNIFPVTEYGTAATYRNITPIESDGADFAQITSALVYDPGAYHISDYNAVLIALERPVAVVSQDWLKAANGMIPQWVDLSDPQFLPRQIEFETAFHDPDLILQGGPGTGILRKDITYEVGISYYCKRLGFESNVVASFTKKIEDDDFNSLDLEKGVKTLDKTNYEELIASGNHIPAWEYSTTKPHPDVEDPRFFHINDWELRFYYRQQGTQEWLPSVFVDAAQFWFSPFGIPSIGSTPIAGLVGGRAGGFVDYSPLPKQAYLCCLIYRNRAFWFTETSAQFSLKDNIFAYPQNNVVNATDGAWRGGIVHIQKGEIEQQSWLIMFGSKSTYSGKFTGKPAMASIRVSENSVGQFNIDGSDFYVDHLCAATSYSHRSAVVADGTLFFWGPQGVYMHEGDGVPVDITQKHRPNILELVDPAKIDEVHAVYNKSTKEVIWFYTPKKVEPGYETYGLLMHTETLEFFNVRWRCRIDAAQNLSIVNDDTSMDLAGERIAVFARDNASANIQRAYFLDAINRSGDMFPGTDFIVKSVSTPSTGIRRFTLAAGFSPTAFANVAVNQPVAIHQANKYAPMLSPAPDFIGTILAKGSDYVDVILPPDLEWDDSASLTFGTYFPIYFEQSTIDWLIETRYWTPAGINVESQFQYLYSFWKFEEWPAVNPPMYELSWRVPIGGPRWAADEGWPLTDNSDGICQAYHALHIDQSQMVGQAIKFRMSGRHLGSLYTLQYLQLEGMPMGTEPLKNFWR